MSYISCENIFLCYNNSIMKTMKKIVLSLMLIALVCVCAVSFAACNNATPQGQLANLWRNNGEYFVYDVTDTSSGETITGSYTVSIKPYDADSDIEDFGGKKLSNVKRGVYVNGRLEINGELYETGCYFEIINGGNFMVPAHTYRVKSVGDAEIMKMSGSYSGNTLNYTLKKDGQVSEGSLSANSPYYDNHEFHQSLRTLTTMSSNFSFSFNVPVVWNQIATVNLTAACKGVEKIKNAFTDTYEKNVTDENGVPAPQKIYAENGIECFKTDIVYSTKVPGSAQTLYYATSDITVNGWPITHALVRMVEPAGTGAVTYNLKTASITNL